MQAVILHAEGDEILAAGVAAKIVPTGAFCERLRADAGSYGERSALFLIWSKRADAQALAQAVSRIASRASGRCIVVRADGTPLPPLPSGASVLATTASASEFLNALAVVRAAAPAPVTPTRRSRARAVIGGWTPGVSIGLAIYAGMFVMAGAWRSDEVNEAIANGQAVPLAGALQSFQTATVAGVDRIQMALAPSEVPTASFQAPQRVVLTGALDTTSIPIIAEAPMVLADDESTPTPIRLQPIDATLSVPPSYTPAGAPLEASLTMASLDTVDFSALQLDVGANEF